jgi:predicted amidophosphoribosyltransferase
VIGGGRSVLDRAVGVTPNLYLGVVLAALFPVACPGCGAPAEPVCPRCVRTLRPPAPSPPPAGVDAWAAPFAYEGAARELVARLKYRNVRAVAPWVAAAMVDALPVLAGRVVVTWAPTTPARRRARGFDPAEVLARPVARRLGVPCAVLVSRRPGPPQTGLPASARQAGPRVVPSPSRAARRHAWGAVVVIVDDVATTGATLGAVAGAVRALGAASVVALTAARTPPPGG